MSAVKVKVHAIIEFSRSKCHNKEGVYVLLESQSLSRSFNLGLMKYSVKIILQQSM